MSEKEWKTVDEFPNYEISKNGFVRNKTTGHIKKPSIGKRGYPSISIYKNGNAYQRTIHILLGRAFINNPENKPQINHIDGNKENYSLSNLEWNTPKENTDHARRTGLHKSDGDKAVIQKDLNGKITNRFRSASEASRITGIGRSSICNVCNKRFCNGRHNYTAGGYKWDWANEE